VVLAKAKYDIVHRNPMIVFEPAGPLTAQAEKIPVFIQMRDVLEGDVMIG
jgi:hypothetical protein